MEIYTKLIEEAKVLLEKDEAYKAKPTKVESARIRKVIGGIQKLAVQAKRDLIEEDKK